MGFVTFGDPEQLETALKVSRSFCADCDCGIFELALILVAFAYFGRILMGSPFETRI